MEWIDIAFDLPGENLAADEVLLEQAEAGYGGRLLRFWESEVPFVVLGHGKKWSEEVDFETCQERQIPILRRCSGGGTVMQGAGCLNYGLVLPLDETGPLATIRGANSYVMERHRALFEGLLETTVRVAGHTDLVVGGLKFSGNAQRRKSRALLFHGTFLLGLDLDLMACVVRDPKVQPAYREGRPHGRFVVNLNLQSDRVKRELATVWGAGPSTSTGGMPGFVEAVTKLALTRYSDPAWNLKF